MKALRDLTLQDLERTAVWRYYGDRDSEAEVEPTDLKEISEAWLSNAPRCYYITRTSFILSDGSCYSGYSSPADDSGLDYIQPVIVLDSVHIPLFYEHSPLGPEPQTTCKKLGRLFSDIFPIRFRSEVLVDGRTVEGLVEAIHVP
jgi:hypothetical protein